MGDLSVQDANSVIEAFPMKTRRHESWKPRSLDVLSDKKTLKASKNADGKVSRNPWYQGRTGNDLTVENACQSCARKSSNSSRAFVHNNRRVSLPSRGKYANVHHSKTNGLHVASVKGNTDDSQGRISHHRLASKEEAVQPRMPDKRWKNKADYFVAVLTYLLGVGNVILFPQLCFKHGGGAFFIPYFIMLCLEGIPLVCLEMAIGQRLGKSSLVEAWKDLSPNLHGIGMAAVMQSLVTCFYYNYIVAWFLHYFFHSLRSTLLWETCPSSWNNGSETINVECEKSGPAEYYWYRQTLDVADDINHSTGINMYLYLFVVIAWTVSFLLSMRGLRRIPKVLLIFLVLIITNLVTFFFLGVHLDGWAEGLARLFIPEWERLLDPVVWMDAAGQIFYSLGVGFGTLIILSGANQPNNNCYEDALICALANCGMSVCASIVMFSFFGFKAYYKTDKCLEMVGKISANGSTSKLGVNVSCSKREIFDQIPPGLSLGFAGLSETFTEISLSPLWSSLFYFLLFCLGSSSMLGTLEVPITTFKEIGFFPQRWRNELLYGGVCLVFCISNLIFVQSTGFYLLEIVSGASSLPLLLTGLAECVGVAYIYGMDKFSKDLALVTGKPVKKRWRICWKFISPLIILGVIIGGMVQMLRNIAYGKFSYTAWDKSKGKIKYQPYPLWGYVFHLAFLLLPCVCIAYPFLKNNWTRNRTDSDHTLCTIVREPSKHCYGGGSRSYQVSLSSDPPYANGHVNTSVDED